MADSLELDPTVTTTQDLIRLDTTNYGEGRSKGETEAAQYLEARLQALGLDVTTIEAAPGRPSIFTRIPGRNTDKPALVVHGHTDVVPPRPATGASTRSRESSRTASCGGVGPSI